MCGIGLGDGAEEASPSASPPSPSDSPLGGGGFAERPESAGSRRSSPCLCAEAGGGLSRDGGAGALALSQRGVVLAGARASRAPPLSASAPSSASIAAPAECAPAFTPPPAAAASSPPSAPRSAPNLGAPVPPLVPPANKARFRILLYTRPPTKVFYVPATSIGRSARLFLVIQKGNFF